MSHSVLGRLQVKLLNSKEKSKNKSKYDRNHETINNDYKVNKYYWLVCLPQCRHELVHIFIDHRSVF
ncbi:unnamed protein product [Leptidea sinapis]|uniref:Uncharacterized protein n=1 Tax=Leptidea sinapis TaxID=189913 RepID=A0A5E4QK09_9NEOP|nr:unnamed protein product [Leptidea sinapis]